MHFLQNLFAVPLELILRPKRFIEDMCLESEQSRSLLLGFPAVLIGVFGILAIVLAQLTNSNLEASYVSALERVSNEKKKLEFGQFSEGRIQQIAEGGDVPFDEAEDPRVEKLEELRAEEDIYLKKLISMNKTKPEYRFRLALAKLRTDPGHGIAILKSLAPEDEAGYSKAHRNLANYYASLPASSRSEAIANAELALIHADHCLQRDKSDKLAKAIKAQLIMNQGRLNEASQLFRELFEEEPVFYRQLLQINNRMDRKDLNKSILERALLSYNERLSREKLNSQTWVAVWKQMIGCYRELKDYKRAAELLEREIDRLAKGADREESVELSQTIRSRRVYLKKLLANVYLNWTGYVMGSPGSTKSDKLKGLSLAKEAYRLGPTDPNVLRLITRLATDKDPEISSVAKEIYDPYQHLNAPAEVLGELGTAAMLTGDFDDAVKFFELARKKNPNDPLILNNLSYSWLRSKDHNANRALQLVDQGLRLISNKPQWAQYRHNFLDTRGTALVQLNRYEEAIAAFEKALTSRPKDINVLKQLVECYRKVNLDASVLINRIKRLEESNEQ